MRRAYYSNTIKGFLADSGSEILGKLSEAHSFAVEPMQKHAWIAQAQILKQQLLAEADTSARLLFEYSIPRMGKRVDVVFLYRGVVFVLEFKVGEKQRPSYAADQALDYCLDLKNFHGQSHDRKIVPIVVATESEPVEPKISSYSDLVFDPIWTNATNLFSVVSMIARREAGPEIDLEAWENSVYRPTPTIIEAAQALYKGHTVREISRSDAGAINLSKTSHSIAEIIDGSKQEERKSICFITGVPGSGKTLAGLNIANQRHDPDQAEHAVFLSGNGPLVEVLKEALARNEVAEKKAAGEPMLKKEARAKASAFIQNIHHFRDDAIIDAHAPAERVVVFDEAQRAWTQEATSRFMKAKKGIPAFNHSEPDFLISVMDRHNDWAVIVCLVGGGQEINKGEAGLPEWFDALQKSYPEWHVYVSNRLEDEEYTQGNDIYDDIADNRLFLIDALHLGVSVRSYRSERVSEWVKEMLDGDERAARETFSEIRKDYPVYLTRDLERARVWLRKQARGTERYGLVASSGAYRLKPYGLNVKAKIDPPIWFLNGKDDVRSSYFLEDVATEFDIQGLELDWMCVAWDINFFRAASDWRCRTFSGTKWKKMRDEQNRAYLKNAYRVLLTRARQGMIIFVPLGSDIDPTREPAAYDSVYSYLSRIGVGSIDD